MNERSDSPEPATRRDERGRFARQPLLVVLVAAVAGAGVALTVHHVVRAAGIPTVTPLIYRGFLEDGTGPVNSPRMIAASLHSAATDGTEYCATTARETPVTAGRFEYALDPACVSALHDHPDTWLQLRISGTPMPRTKLGAVPYAVEADSASNAAGALQRQIADLQARIAAAESRDVDCPRGYTRVMDATFTGDQRLCANGDDQVVRVGTGNEAFWVDRYEASVWQNANGSGDQYGATLDYPMGFPRNGQWTTRVYALSKAGVRPSVSLTWFQASEACRASGKRLPTGDEWLAAARGTPDNGSDCRIDQGTPGSSRQTNAGTACRSAWGAGDMIGNVWEWTAEWYAGAGSTADFINNPAGMGPWPAGYGDDATWNVGGYTANGTTNLAGLPAAALRGGAWNSGSRAGRYALNLGNGPSYADFPIGFRCVLHR
ncbi:MAG: SUMF1/EgtB/PvdO family nonheme iron enzyme [Polyangiales bacterium]